MVIPTPEQHRDRERAYLTEIAEVLATGPNPVAAKVVVLDHSGIPVLDFPDLDDTEAAMTVWANWEADDADTVPAHAMSICPATADEFPALPDGTQPGDAAKAAKKIRAWITKKNGPTTMTDNADEPLALLSPDAEGFSTLRDALAQIADGPRERAAVESLSRTAAEPEKGTRVLWVTLAQKVMERPAWQASLAERGFRMGSPSEALAFFDKTRPEASPAEPGTYAFMIQQGQYMWGLRDDVFAPGVEPSADFHVGTYGIASTFEKAVAALDERLDRIRTDMFRIEGDFEARAIGFGATTIHGTTSSWSRKVVWINPSTGEEKEGWQAIQIVFVDQV